MIENKANVIDLNIKKNHEISSEKKLENDSRKVNIETRKTINLIDFNKSKNESIQWKNHSIKNSKQKLVNIENLPEKDNKNSSNLDKINRNDKENEFSDINQNKISVKDSQEIDFNMINNLNEENGVTNSENSKTERKKNLNYRINDNLNFESKYEEIDFNDKAQEEKFRVLKEELSNNIDHENKLTNNNKKLKKSPTRKTLGAIKNQDLYNRTNKEKQNIIDNKYKNNNEYLLSNNDRMSNYKEAEVFTKKNNEKGCEEFILTGIENEDAKNIDQYDISLKNKNSSIFFL